MPVINIHKTDWFRILCDLNRKGHSLQTIAEELHVVPSTLIGWKRGSVPLHHTGEALIDMWCRETGKARHEVPREKLLQKFIFHSANRS